jgi:hypothetical protein
MLEEKSYAMFINLVKGSRNVKNWKNADNYS